VLPTFLGVSTVSFGSIIGSLVGFVLFYSALAIVDVALMVRAIRHGPPSAETTGAVPVSDTAGED